MSNLGNWPAGGTVVVGGTVTVADDKAEDSPAVSGDTGSFILAVRNDALAVRTNTDGDYSPFSVDARGGILEASNFAEDSPHTSGDIGTFALGVRNDSSATLAGSDLDYSPFAVTPQGAMRVTMSATQAATADVMKAEDVASASGFGGVCILTVRRDTDGTQTSANGDFAEVQTDDRGSVRVNSVMRAPTGTLTNVANAVASFTALAANVARRGATIYNDDTAVTGAVVKIKFGAVAAAASFTTVLAPATYYEVPFGYTGIIDAIASAATGNLRVTELT